MDAGTEVSSLKLAINRKYGDAADSDPAVSCCGGGSQYGKDIPLGAKNASLGCGSPVDHITLHEGVTLVDLGSGGGVDAFAAARKEKLIRVIGVDSTTKMVARARRTATENHFNNVEFRLGEIENIPIAGDTADVIISNCAVNLVPDKSRAFSEMFRILKRGGKLTISDIIANEKIPERVKSNPAKWSECVSGALSLDDLQSYLNAAGFVKFEILEASKWEKTDDEDLNLASVTFSAEKPI